MVESVIHSISLFIYSPFHIATHNCILTFMDSISEKEYRDNLQQVPNRQQVFIETTYKGRQTCSQYLVLR